MKTTSLVLLLMIAMISSVSAQKYLTKNGHIRFYSEAPLENIEADNRQVTSIYDAETGEFAFSLLMKGFHFEKALMEEHFNEKYVHSDKFPKSMFKGQVADFNSVDIASGLPQEVTVYGTLTLHGVEKELSASGVLHLTEGKLHARSVFPLTLSDFDITIPGVVKDNIAKTVEVTVEMVYDLYNK